MNYIIEVECGYSQIYEKPPSHSHNNARSHRFYGWSVTESVKTEASNLQNPATVDQALGTRQMTV